jgi:aerotaxis receptor
MPPAAYKDMWATIGRGHPWTGIVKNRTKDGDYYWVQANVTPIINQGKPVGYMSVRIKPTSEEVRGAQALYQQLNAAGDSNQVPFYLQGGQVRYRGLRGIFGAVKLMAITTRLAVALALMIALAMLPQFLDVQGLVRTGVQLAILLLGAGLVLFWFHERFATAILVAEGFTNDLDACNLTTTVASNYPPPHGNPDTQLAPNPDQSARSSGRCARRNCQPHPVGCGNCRRRHGSWRKPPPPWKNCPAPSKTPPTLPSKSPPRA